MSILSLPRIGRPGRGRRGAFSRAVLVASFAAALGLVVVAADADAKRRRAGFRSHSGHRHHAHRHSGHGYRRHVYRHRYYGRHYGAYYDPFYVHQVVPLEPRYPVPPEARGWAYLERGDAKRALSVFAHSARRDENDAAAQLGYAVASTEIGDLDRAVWAMRRAALTDAAAFEAVPLSERGRARLLDVARSMHDLDAGARQADEHFLLAGLLFAAGKPSAADAALAAAREFGDDSPSARALGRAIEAAMEAPTGS